MNEIKQRIKELAKEIATEIIDIRRHIHMYPELSMQEDKTSQFIQDKLTEWGIPFESGIAKTGVVATINGAGSGPTIALRADIDALPIQEQNELPYKSLVPGVMHACGHDVHTASLLGTIKILNSLKNSFSGKVRCLFQPSEERYPGGASLMIQEGVLENPVPEMIFGQHVFPELESGKIGVRPGKYMASTDEFFIKVKGRGGHGAIPNQNVDPVLASAHIITALQQIVSRNAKPSLPSVLSIGRLTAFGQTNIIPDEVNMDGIIRTFDEEWRAEMKLRIVEIAEYVAKGFGATAEVKIDKGYPFLENDNELAKEVKNEAIAFLGEENVVDLELRMTAEDFAYYTQIIPGCFYRLGTMNKDKNITSNLHTSTFNVDEASLETGMGFMAWICMRTFANGV